MTLQTFGMCQETYYTQFSGTGILFILSTGLPLSRTLLPRYKITFKKWKQTWSKHLKKTKRYSSWNTVIKTAMIGTLIWITHGRHKIILTQELTTERKKRMNCEQVWNLIGQYYHHFSYHEYCYHCVIFLLWILKNHENV